MTTNANGVKLNANIPYGKGSGLVDEYGNHLATEPSANCEYGDRPTIEHILEPTVRNLATIFQVGKRDKCGNFPLDGNFYDIHKAPVNQGWMRGLFELPPGITICGMSTAVIKPVEGVVLKFSIQDIDGNVVTETTNIDLSEPLNPAVPPAAPTLGAADPVHAFEVVPAQLLLAKHYLMVEVVTSPNNPDDCDMLCYAVRVSLQIKDYCHEEFINHCLVPQLAGTRSVETIIGNPIAAVPGPGV